MSDPPTLRFMLAHPSREFRERLFELFVNTPELRCVGAAPGIRALRRHKQPPQLLLLEPVPSLDRACSQLRDLKARFPELRILIVTHNEDPQRMLPLLAAGADGYWSASAPLLSLVEAIEEIRKGGAPLAAATRAQLVAYLHQAGARGRRLDSLSRRERQILTGLARGAAYKELAAQLTLRIDTIRSYVRRLYHKLRVHSRGEAVALWLRHKM